MEPKVRHFNGVLAVIQVYDPLNCYAESQVSGKELNQWLFLQHNKETHPDVRFKVCIVQKSDWRNAGYKTV